MAAVGQVKATPVIIHESLANAEGVGNTLRQKQLKVRVSEAIVPGSVIFPQSGVAFLMIPLSKVTCTDPDTQQMWLTEEIVTRLDRFVQTHKCCYGLCLAPLHGATEKHVFSLIQKKYLHTRLDLTPLHNMNEAVQFMMNVAKALCKPVDAVLWGRLSQVMSGYQETDFMSLALKQLGLTNIECELIQDGLGSLSKLATATRTDLLNCSLDSETVTKIHNFFTCES